MRELPETFTSIRAKMNGNVKFAIDEMNKALMDMCSSEDVSSKEKLRATQDYLALFMRLESEVSKEKEQREIMKQRKLNTRIKESEVAKIEAEEEGVPSAIVQSKFSSSMSVN